LIQKLYWKFLIDVDDSGKHVSASHLREIGFVGHVYSLQKMYKLRNILQMGLFVKFVN